MKKIIMPISFILLGIVIPVAGMTITPTRNLILGLAPKEAVLELADKIDKSRAENEAKLQEMQTLLGQQKATIEEQNQKLEETNAALNDTPTEEEIKTIAAEAAYCETNAANYTQEKYEAQKERSDEDEVRDSCLDEDSNDCDKTVRRYKKYFENYKIKYEEYHKRCL